MRILTYPHDLGMGGSQLNAIDLSAEIQRAGHEVVIYGQSGVLVDYVHAAGLEFIESPRARVRPTPSIVADLRGQVRRRQIDVVHGYEWPPTLEAILACRATDATAVSTVLSMSVAPFIPDYVPLMVVTEQILAAEREFGRRTLDLMEPPVDTRLNSPDVDLPTQEFIRQWDLDPDAFRLVVVSRLAHEMKSEGILTAVEAVGHLATRHHVQLVVVGGGPALELVRERAQRVNSAVGREAVVVTGELADPRPAYAVADTVLGMGSSALRAMAFGKPLMVLGIDGFVQPLTAETLPMFHWQGFYGQGPGRADAAERMAGHIAELVTDPDEVRRRAALALRVARQRYSLTAAAERQLAFYERQRHNEQLASASGRSGANALSAARFICHQMDTRIKTWRGTAPAEDFNSRAVLATGPAGREEAMRP